MATLRMFASIRVAAGVGRDQLPGTTVRDVLDAAAAKYGSEFGEILPQCRIWVNGDEASADDAVTDADEVALLPPVSGG